LVQTKLNQRKQSGNERAAIFVIALAAIFNGCSLLLPVCICVCVCVKPIQFFFLFIWSGIKKEKLETKNTSGQAETETRTAKTTAANLFSKRTLKMPPLLHVFINSLIFTKKER